MTPPFEFPEAGASAPASGASPEKGKPMGLQRYTVKEGRYETVLLLSDEHANELGLSDKDLAESKKSAPAKKAAPAAPAAKKASAKKAAPANKARTADADKDA